MGVDVEAFCAEIAAGKSLRAICREKGLDESTARYHLNKPENFPQYARARELQADSFFDAIVDIADGTDPSAMSDREDRKIQIDARKWAAGKLKGKYSEKATVELTGRDGGPIQSQSTIDAKGLNDEQLRALASIRIPSE